MKKITDRKRHFRNQRRAAARQSKARWRRRRFLAAKRRALVGLPQMPGVRIRVPAHFSVVNAPDATLRLLSQMQTRCGFGDDVVLDFRGVEELTVDAILLALAYSRADKITRKQGVSANEPADPALRDFYRNSGIREHIVPIRKRDRRYPLPMHSESGIIRARSEKRVSTKIAQDAVRQATTLLYGEPRRAPGVYRALIECMANTHDHAGGTEEGKESWWLGMARIPSSNRVGFAFVDTGVGLFRGRKVRSIIGRLTSIIADIARGRGPAVQVMFQDPYFQTLFDLFHGHVESRTGLRHRGRGLPAIRQCIDRGQIRHLIVVANNVYANMETMEFRRLPHPLYGTFLYWEYAATSGPPAPDPSLHDEPTL